MRAHLIQLFLVLTAGIMTAANVPQVPLLMVRPSMLTLPTQNKAMREATEEKLNMKLFYKMWDKLLDVTDITKTDDTGYNGLTIVTADDQSFLSLVPMDVLNPFVIDDVLQHSVLSRQMFREKIVPTDDRLKAEEGTKIGTIRGFRQLFKKEGDKLTIGGIPVKAYEIGDDYAIYILEKPLGIDRLDVEDTFKRRERLGLSSS